MKKPNNIKYANEIVSNIGRIPSGVFAFDVLTGGGIPINKISIFEGNKASGKTTMSYKIIANFLEMYPDKQVLYADFEHSFDKEWISVFINESALNRVLVITPTYAEEGIDIIQNILTDENFNIGFLFIDSVAAMIPIADGESSAMDNFVGLFAKTYNKLLRKILISITAYSKVNKTLTTLLINQLRVKIGAAAFTPTSVKAGGVFQEFVNHLDVRFFYIEDIVRNSIPIKRKHQLRIEKAKLKNAYEHSKGEFSIVKVPHDNLKIGQSDDANTILVYAKKYNVITRNGNKWVIFGEEFKNQGEILLKMANSPDFYKMLYNKTQEEIFNNVLPEVDASEKEIE